MSDHVRNQPVALGIVHHLVRQVAGPAEIVVILARRIGGADKVAAGRPDGDLQIEAGIGHGTALGVGRTDRIGHVFHPHRAVLAVAVDRDLLVVHPEPCAVSIGIGKDPGQQHLVRSQADAGRQIVRLEGRLFDFGTLVGRIAVEHQHDLHMKGPARVVARGCRTSAQNRAGRARCPGCRIRRPPWRIEPGRLFWCPWNTAALVQRLTSWVTSKAPIAPLPLACGWCSEMRSRLKAGSGCCSGRSGDARRVGIGSGSIRRPVAG